MKRLARASIILSLIDQLKAKGSWCGETHIQKTGYVLQELLGVPLEFDFVMYKHGPFAFDLRDELTALRADGLLELDVQSPYGPKYVTTQRGKDIQDLHPKTLAKHEEALEFVAEQFGNKKATELERLTTALLITRDPGFADASVNGRARELHRLKPHVPESEARGAVTALDRIQASALGRFA